MCVNERKFDYLFICCHKPFLPYKNQTKQTDLRLLLDSIRKFHNSEVENFKKKIEHLEKIAAKKKPPPSQLKLDYDDSILDEDDDDVVLLNNNIPASINNNSMTNTEPIINPGQQACIGINKVKEEGEKEI
uniref:Uncharacterized protein n=1 Tax=Meloidogyne hapla TaxID=6305 RepID=A0A1I8BZQ2_MELHA